MGKSKEMNVYVKVRTCVVGPPISDVWLIERDGVSEVCLAHGEMGPGRLERFIAWAEALGMAVEREESALEGARISKPTRRLRK